MKSHGCDGPSLTAVTINLKSEVLKVFLMPPGGIDIRFWDIEYFYCKIRNVLHEKGS